MRLSWGYTPLTWSTTRIFWVFCSFFEGTQKDTYSCTYAHTYVYVDAYAYVCVYAYEYAKRSKYEGMGFVPNVDGKKCQKMYFLIKNGPSGRFPRCKMASKHIPDQFPTIPHQYPYQKHPKSAKIDQNRSKIKKIEQKIKFLALAWGLTKEATMLTAYSES